MAVLPAASNKANCEFMRTVFTAYWTNTSPSTEDIYLSALDQDWAMTYANIQAVQAYVLNLIQTNITANECLGVILQSYLFLDVSANDRQALGWRVVTGNVI
jgi:hypothetical protein